MTLHIRSKYTAVGRKEIIMFFQMYAVIESLATFLDSAIIPIGNPTYPWFAAICFQFADGTPLSLWFLRISCHTVFSASSQSPLLSNSSVSPTQILLHCTCSGLYLRPRLHYLATDSRLPNSRWPIDDIVFGAAFSTFITSHVC